MNQIELGSKNQFELGVPVCFLWCPSSLSQKVPLFVAGKSKTSNRGNGKTKNPRFQCHFSTKGHLSFHRPFRRLCRLGQVALVHCACRMSLKLKTCNAQGLPFLGAVEDGRRTCKRSFAPTTGGLCLKDQVYTYIYIYDSESSSTHLNT